MYSFLHLFLIFLLFFLWGSFFKNLLRVGKKRKKIMLLFLFSLFFFLSFSYFGKVTCKGHMFENG